jgi:hypothetical protein
MIFETRLKAVKSALEAADFVLIGAGAGFSEAAGLTYSGLRFTDNFQPFIKKYGMTDMYSADFYLLFMKPMTHDGFMDSKKNHHLKLGYLDFEVMIKK